MVSDTIRTQTTRGDAYQKSNRENKEGESCTRLIGIEQATSDCTAQEHFNY